MPKMQGKSRLKVKRPRFEFIDTQTDLTLSYNPSHNTEKNYWYEPHQKRTCSAMRTNMFDPLRIDRVIEPPDPLDVSEIKIEPNTLEYDFLTDIKMEEDDLINKAFDVGDHNYSFVNKIEHSYAKTHERGLECIGEDEETVNLYVEMEEEGLEYIMNNRTDDLMIFELVNEEEEDQEVPLDYSDMTEEELKKLLSDNQLEMPEPEMSESVINIDSSEENESEDDLVSLGLVNGTTDQYILESPEKVLKRCGNQPKVFENQPKITKILSGLSRIQPKVYKNRNKSLKSQPELVSQNQLNTPDNQLISENQSEVCKSAPEISVTQQNVSGNQPLGIVVKSVTQNIVDNQNNLIVIDLLLQTTLNREEIHQIAVDCAKNSLINVPGLTTIQPKASEIQPEVENGSQNIIGPNQNNPMTIIRASDRNKIKKKRLYRAKVVEESPSILSKASKIQPKGIGFNSTDENASPNVLGKQNDRPINDIEEIQERRKKIEEEFGNPPALSPIQPKGTENRTKTSRNQPEGIVFDLANENVRPNILGKQNNHPINKRRVDCTEESFKNLPTLIPIQSEISQNQPKSSPNQKISDNHPKVLENQIEVAENQQNVSGNQREDSFVDLGTESLSQKIVDKQNIPMVIDSVNETASNCEEIREIRIDRTKVPDLVPIQSKLLENRVSQDLIDKHKWQMDVETLLKKMYLKESGVSSEMPLNPLATNPVIDLLSDSCDSDIDTVRETRLDDKVPQGISAIPNNTPQRDISLTYECSTCKYYSPFEEVIRNHLKIHGKLQEKQERYQCPACPFKAGHKHVLIDHLKAHGTENLYKCPKCPYNYKDREELIRHLNVHADTLPFVCKICCYRTRDKKSLLLHKTIHRDVFSCYLCGFKTNNTYGMELHMGKHARKKSYRCYQCDFVTWYASELVLHKQSHLALVNCFVCHQEMSGSEFEMHRKTHAVKCKECDFVGASNGTLEIHTKNVHFVKAFG